MRRQAIFSMKDYLTPHYLIFGSCLVFKILSRLLKLQMPDIKLVMCVFASIFSGTVVTSFDLVELILLLAL
jgi:hypothetical protein